MGDPPEETLAVNQFLARVDVAGIATTLVTDLE